jgi:hypothetical protein
MRCEVTAMTEMTGEQRLEDLLPEAESEEQERLSRRQFLTGAVAGGAAGLVVATGTGVAVWNLAEAEAQTSLETADAEIARLQGLLDLYEDLERVGLDAILEVGMSAVALPLALVEEGAKALKTGLDMLEEAILSLQEALPTAQESILWLEAQVSTVAEAIEKLETGLVRALDRAASSPVGEKLADFAGIVLDNLPFGLGDRIRDVLDGLVHLVTSVDELVEGINTQALEPLREKWFPVDRGEGTAVTFLDPLIDNALDPLEAHLGDLAALADTWQQKLVAPTEHALAERARIREEIARYKGEQSIG